MLETIAAVIGNEVFGSAYCMLRLEIKPSIEVSPGQFAMLKPANQYEPLLRRAMAFYKVESDADSTKADFVFQILGRGTEALSQSRVDQKVEFLGPLGKSFSIEPAEKSGGAIVVAGGVGSPGVLMLAEALRNRRVPTSIFLGARSRNDLIGVEDFASLGFPLTITTDDGSEGEKGFVTEPFERFLRECNEKNYTVYTCGPEPMMRRAAEISESCGVKVYASLEARMACGFGVCVGCVVETRSESVYQRVCVEGPVFDGSEVVW